SGAVMSYCCDRGRSTTWGINGGLPSIPHGVWLNPSAADRTYLGATFSNVSIAPGDSFERPSAGGGGFGDPLERTTAEVHEVVIAESAAGLDECDVDGAAPTRDRARIRAERAAWLDTAAAEVARRYREGEITVHDVIRRYGVVLDWGTGELLEKSTGQFRESM